MINIGIERTRRCDWLDTENNVVQYGIQVKLVGVWYNASESGTLLLYGTAEERDAKLAAIRKDLRAGNKIIPKLRETARCD